jgi:hypothetical protein
MLADKESLHVVSQKQTNHIIYVVIFSCILSFLSLCEVLSWTSSVLQGVSPIFDILLYGCLIVSVSLDILPYTDKLVGALCIFLC